MTIPLFPLGTVLFTGGYLPLRIFEPRYLKMVRQCRESDTGFGVVLIREGFEVHQEDEEFPPDLYRIGTLAEIVQFEEVQDNLLSLLTKGIAKFSIDTTWEEDDHLRMGEVSFTRDEPKVLLEDSEIDFKNLLEALVSGPDTPEFVRDSIDWEDANDISTRLADFLPIDLAVKQELLELDSARLRFSKLRTVLGT